MAVTIMVLLSVMMTMKVMRVNDSIIIGDEYETRLHSLDNGLGVLMLKSFSKILSHTPFS
jgi:hypothetical protein